MSVTPIFRRPARNFRETVDTQGSLEGAVANKYPELFSYDPVLKSAWADYEAAKARIYERMDELARAQDAAQGTSA